MATLNWAPDRSYQSGVSKGVIYPKDNAPVVWNGLTSVTDTSNGQELEPIFIDGQVNSVSGGQNSVFSATVKSVTKPMVFFAEAEGSRGLRLQRQPSKRFDFSYRTEKEDGYRIHLVYNALFTPSGTTYETYSDGTTFTAFEWALTSTPVAVSGLYPSSHYFIDSNKVLSDNMNELETIIYGDSVVDPEMPTVQELITLISEW